MTDMPELYQFANNEALTGLAVRAGRLLLFAIDEQINFMLPLELERPNKTDLDPKIVVGFIPEPQTEPVPIHRIEFGPMEDLVHISFTSHTRIPHFRQLEQRLVGDAAVYEKGNVVAGEADNLQSLIENTRQNPTKFPLDRIYQNRLVCELYTLDVMGQGEGVFYFRRLPPGGHLMGFNKEDGKMSVTQVEDWNTRIDRMLSKCQNLS